MPLSGGIIRHAEYFFDPAMAFANGWNQVYSYMVSLPAEIVAAAVIVDFWASINNAVWITIFGLLLVAANIFVGTSQSLLVASSDRIAARTHIWRARVHIRHTQDPVSTSNQSNQADV